MKFREKLKEKNVQIYILGIITYVVGMLADGFGYLNEFINFVGVFLTLASAVFIITLQIIWSFNNELEDIKEFIISLSSIVIGTIVIAICSNLKMTSVLITMGLYCLVNVIDLLLCMCYIVKDYNYRKKESSLKKDGKMICNMIDTE